MPSTLARGRRPWLIAGPTIVLSAVLALAGCAGGQGAGTTSLSGPSDGATSDSASDGTMADGASDGTMSDGAMADGAAPAGAMGTPLSQTNPALDFAAVDLEGSAVTGVEGPVVLWFWAPWCPICRGEAPALVKEVEASPGVTFIGVASLDEVPAMQAFVSETGTGGFRHLADPGGEIWARFGVTSQPAMAFISSDGQVKVVPGAMAPQDVLARVAELE